MESSKNVALNTTQQSVVANKPHAIYRNIIFDLGKVLIHWDPDAFIRDIFKEEYEQVLRVVQEVMVQRWVDYDRGLITTHELAAVLKTEQEKQQLLYFLDIVPRYMISIPQGVEWFNRAQAKGYRMYLLSNFPKDLYYAVAAQNSFFNRIDGAVISFQIQKMKPEPEIYQALLTKYALKPEECLFIDDREENIQAGKALGIDGIVCDHHARVDKVLTDLCIF